MPIPADLVKVNTTFDLGPGQDVAVFGYHLRRIHTGGNVVNWPADVQVIAEIARDTWAEQMTENLWASSVKALHTTAYHLDTSGHAIDKGLAVFSGDSTWQGTATYSLPWEVSMCVTLDCYDPDAYTPHRGRQRGRFYLPAPTTGFISDNTGKMSNGNYDTLADDLTDYLDVMSLFPLAALPNDSFEMGVLSRAASEFYGLQRVRMDNKFDVQRRRENRQTSTYRDLWTAP